MEHNESFPVTGLNEITIRLSWAQLEIYADDIEQIQLIASGDEHTLNDLRIEVKEDALVVEQPQYGISLDFIHGHWMQLCVRVPKTWDRSIRANTVSGMLGARGLGGDSVELDTVIGEIKASKITAGQLALRTIAGSIRGDQLIAKRLTGRSVSGGISLGDVTAQTCRFTSVSGDMDIRMASSFEQIELRTVSGDASIHTGMETLNVSLRTISGHRDIDGVKLTEDGSAPSVRAVGVTGNLKITGSQPSTGG